MRYNRAREILVSLKDAQSKGLTDVIVVASGEHPSRRDRFDLDATVDELIEVIEGFLDLA